MTLPQTISNKTHLIAAFIMGCVLFLAFSFFLYQEYSFGRRTNESVIHSYEELRIAREILTDVLSMETGVRGYLLTEQPPFLQPYHESRIWLGNEVDELKQLISDSNGKVQADTTNVLNEIQKFDALLAAEIRLAHHPMRVAVLEQTIRQQKNSMDHLRQSFQGFIQISQTNLDAQLNKLKQKQQSFIFVLATGTLGIIGVMFLAMLAILSLTKRNRASEEIVRASEQRFRMVMDGINDGLYDHDIIKGTIYLSPAFKTMLGFTDAELPNSMDTLHDLVHPEDTQQLWETLHRYQNHETQIYVNYFRMRHKEGGWRWIMSRGIGIWDKNNTMVRLIGTHTDITDQKKREEELRALNTDLENFAYIASHDLRAPLVNLKGFAREMEHSLEVVKPILERAETALSDQDKKQTQQIFERDIPESLKFIQQSVDKMDTLTNAVLNLSRIGRREFVLEAVDTHAITSRCVDGLAYEIGQKNVAVQLDALPVILSDAAAFEQIICNLLDNAVKYLEPTRKGIIKISYQIQNDEIIFSVQDNGRGIEPADRQKVFEIFRRARNAGSERGTGMGLAYVKATLRKLGGSIWFETGDVGVTFYFKLPVKSAAQPETTEPLEMAA